MIPTKPEPYEQLQARFQIALAKSWEAGVAAPDRPGLHRTYIFDTLNGVRFIVSRETVGDSGVFMLHASASFFVPQRGHWGEFRTRQRRPSVRFANANEGITEVKRELAKIVGTELPEPRVGMSPGSVMHLTFPLKFENDLWVVC